MVYDRDYIIVLFHHLGPYHLARLQKAAEKVQIIGIEISDRSYGYDWNADREVHTNLKRITLFSNTDSRQLSGFVILKRIAGCLDGCKPVCVALPGWSPVYALATLWWCVKNNIPAICMGDSTAWDWERIWWKEWYKKRIMKAFTAALAAGQATRKYFQKLGMSDGRIFLGYDVVDNKYFESQVQKVQSFAKKVRKELKLNHPFFLSSARFIPRKNLFRLIEAYAKYRKVTLNSWDLVILGDGELMPHVKELVGKLKIKGDIVLPGFKQYNELPQYYGLANCFIHVSTTEQWGLVVNEAMASGLPVIVSKRCGCAQDLIENGGNGFIVDPFSVDDIAEKMIKVTSLSESERKAMGQKSQEIIADWGLGKFVSGLRAAVDRALEDGPKKITIFNKLLLKALILKP